MQERELAWQALKLRLRLKTALEVEQQMRQKKRKTIAILRNAYSNHPLGMLIYGDPTGMSGAILNMKMISEDNYILSAIVWNQPVLLRPTNVAIIKVKDNGAIDVQSLITTDQVNENGIGRKLKETNPNDVEHLCMEYIKGNFTREAVQYYGYKFPFILVQHDV